MSSRNISSQNTSSLFGNIKPYDVKKFLGKILQKKKITYIAYKNFVSLLDLNIKPYYSKENLAIYLEKNYLKKIKESNISKEKLYSELSNNLIYASKYTDTKSINKAQLDLLVLNDNVFRNTLKTNKETLQKMFKIEDFRTKFLGLFGDKIKDPNDLFKLFTFDFDTIFKKEYSPYIFILTNILNNNEIENIRTKNDMIKHNLWKIPVFNTPRDIILKSEKSLEYFVENIHISPEYRLMKLLLDKKIIKHNFNIDEIDYILSVYRCCVGGDINDILEIFKNNSKYFSILPFIALLDCKLNDISEQFCKTYSDFYDWTPLKNSVGFETAAGVPIIFPYMFKSNILKTRYETISFETYKNIGTLIIKNPNENVTDPKYKEYLLYNIKIKNKDVMFFDIYNNRVHLKESPISYQRVQLLESKWAINRLIWLLEHSKVTPLEDKKCDVIIYRTKKDYYLFSLFNKSEINKMYENLRISLNQKIKDVEERKLFDDLIQTFICELNEYEEITKYRLHKDNQTLFIWQIDPSELSSWNEDKIINGKKIDNCINSDLYINMLSGKEEFNKIHIALDFDKKEQILEFPDKIFYKAKKYHNDDEYRIYIDNQKEIYDEQIKLNCQSISNSTPDLKREEKPVISEIEPNGQKLSEKEMKKYLKYKIKYLKLKNLISTNL